MAMRICQNVTAEGRVCEKSAELLDGQFRFCEEHHKAHIRYDCPYTVRVCEYNRDLREGILCSIQDDTNSVLLSASHLMCELLQRAIVKNRDSSLAKVAAVALAATKDIADAITAHEDEDEEGKKRERRRSGPKWRHSREKKRFHTEEEEA